MARQGNWPFRASRHPLVATAFVAVLGTCGVALFVPGGRAASLCPDTYTHYCFNGQGNFYVHDVGFSTTGPPCSHGGSGYGDVYLSSSDTDPHVNQGPIYHDSLFFWASSAGPGYGFEMSLTSIGGDIEITGFEFAPGTNGKFIPPGTLWWGNCADGQVLVGRLIVEQPIAVEPETWGRMKALYR